MKEGNINSLEQISIITEEMISQINRLQNDFVVGRYHLSEGVVISAENYFTVDDTEKEYENHYKHAFVHIVLDGEEVIWTAPANDKAFETVESYDPVADVEILDGEVSEYPIMLALSEFCILYPGEAYKAGTTVHRYGHSQVKKIIIKIPV